MMKLLPLLIAAKVKLGILATLAYFVIHIVAKKAIFSSLIALAISGFIGLKSLWNKDHHHHHEVTSYNSAWSPPVSGGWTGPVSSGGWSAPVSGGWNSGSSAWEDPHAYSHSQAYSGYQH